MPKQPKNDVIILWRKHTGQPSKDIHKKYRASVLLRSYYIVEDGKCPYLDATKKPDTRYSYLYSALLADMNIFSGINIRWIDEPSDVPLPLKTSIRKNINPVKSDPEGYQRLWRFKIISRKINV